MRPLRFAVALLAVTLLVAPATASFELSLDKPRSPLAPGASATFNATVSLDCQTALQWTLASSGATSIPVAVHTGAAPGLTLSGASTIALDTTPCQSPSATQATARSTYGLAAAPLAPALQDLSTWLRATMPAAGVAGNTVVQSQEGNKSTSLQVQPVLSLAAHANTTSFDVTSDVLDFNVTFQNLGNIPMQLLINSTTEAVIEAPTIHLGALAQPGSGSANFTAPFRFHAPLGSWTQATARILVVPQVQTLSGVLHGNPVQLEFTFSNHIPSKKSPAPVAPLVGVLLVGLTAAQRRSFKRPDA